jgi:hypothetical protein
VVAGGLGAVEPDGGGVVDLDLEDVFLEQLLVLILVYNADIMLATYVLARSGGEEAGVETTLSLGLARSSKVGSNNAVVLRVVVELQNVTDSGLDVVGGKA